MNPELRTLRSVSLLAALALVLLVPTAGVSEEAEYLTAEQYIELARPYLHLSCEGAWQLVDEGPGRHRRSVHGRSPRSPGLMIRT